MSVRSSTRSKANPVIVRKLVTNESRCKDPSLIPLICHNDTYTISNNICERSAFAVFLERKQSSILSSVLHRSERAVLLPTTGVVVEICQIVSSTHMRLGSALPRRRRSAEPRRRGKRYTRWEARGTEARRCTWHSWWREWHRGSREGRWPRCRGQKGR